MPSTKTHPAISLVVLDMPDNPVIRGRAQVSRAVYYTGGRRVTPEDFADLVRSNYRIVLNVWGLVTVDGPWITGRVQSLQILGICPRCARSLGVCTTCGNFHRCDPSRLS